MSDHDHDNLEPQVTGEAARDPNISKVAYYGIVLALGFYVLVVFIIAFYNNAQAAETYRKQILPPTELQTRIQAEQVAVMAEYRWVNREAGVVGLPIRQAMEQVAGELGAPATGK